jgi:hypothetical protein
MTGKNALAARKRGVQGGVAQPEIKKKNKQNSQQMSSFIVCMFFQTKCLLSPSKQILPLSFKTQLTPYNLS